MDDYDEADEVGRNVTHLAKPGGQQSKVIVTVDWTMMILSAWKKSG